VCGCVCVCVVRERECGYELLKQIIPNKDYLSGLVRRVQAGLIKHFDMDAGKLLGYMKAVEQGMPANEYHNKEHAADVFNSAVYLLVHVRPPPTLHSTLCRVLLTAQYVRAFKSFQVFLIES
jgi:hypothetical protein